MRGSADRAVEARPNRLNVRARALPRVGSDYSAFRVRGMAARRAAIARSRRPPREGVLRRTATLPRSDTTVTRRGVDGERNARFTQAAFPRGGGRRSFRSVVANPKRRPVRRGRGREERTEPSCTVRRDRRAIAREIGRSCARASVYVVMSSNRTRRFPAGTSARTVLATGLRAARSRPRDPRAREKRRALGRTRGDAADRSSMEHEREEID